MDTPTEQTGEQRQPASLPPARKKASVLLIACILALSCLLVGSGVLWQQLAGAHNTRRTGNTQPPATATSIPLWTPTEVTPPATSTFYETFVNNQHGWSLSGTGGDFRVLTDHRLILASTNPDTTLIESVPTSTVLDNYVVSVDFTLNLGDTHDGTGLYVRGDSHLDHDYRIDINGNQTVDVAKEWLDSAQTPQSTLLSPPRPTHLLNPPGQINTLTVFLINQTITVQLNNVAITTIFDPSYSNGQVALFVHHAQSPRGAVYSFSRVEIDRLASPFVTPTPDD